MILLYLVQICQMRIMDIAQEYVHKNHYQLNIDLNGVHFVVEI